MSRVIEVRKTNGDVIDTYTIGQFIPLTEHVWAEYHDKGYADYVRIMPKKLADGTDTVVVTSNGMNGSKIRVIEIHVERTKDFQDPAGEPFIP